MDFLDFLIDDNAILGIVLLVAIAVVIFKRFGKASLVSLSLSKYCFNPDSSDEPLLLEGRKSGLWQWILAKLRLGNKFQIAVKADHINYSADSARGNTLALTPMAKIASTACGYRKPIGFLITACILLLFGLFQLFNGEFGFFLTMLLFAVLMVVYYIYKKTFFIEIHTTAGVIFGFSFKRSFIENVDVNIELIQKSIAHLNEKIVAKNR